MALAASSNILQDTVLGYSFVDQVSYYIPSSAQLDLESLVLSLEDSYLDMALQTSLALVLARFHNLSAATYRPLD